MAKQPDVEIVPKVETENKEIITEGVTPVHDKGGGYVEFEDKLFQKEALKELRPDLFKIQVDTPGNQSQTNFGVSFPKIGKKGDIFVRVDIMPNRVFKFDGKKWLEQNKELTQSYLDGNYLEYLVDKVGKGEYDLEQLTDMERIELEDYLKRTQNT